MGPYEKMKIDVSKWLSPKPLIKDKPTHIRGDKPSSPDLKLSDIKKEEKDISVKGFLVKPPTESNIVGGINVGSGPVNIGVTRVQPSTKGGWKGTTGISGDIKVSKNINIGVSYDTSSKKVTPRIGFKGRISNLFKRKKSKNTPLFD